MMYNSTQMIAVVIPCYRVRAHIANVVKDIGPEVQAIYCVDDACPDGSGDFIQTQIKDPRIKLLRHTQRKGVGGAMVTGYRRALEDGATIIVKVDGDGQMNTSHLTSLTQPIAGGDADYTKGNRFFRIEDMKQMPSMRLCGNAILSFISKFSTGYWNIFDPTNGFTAIHSKVLRLLPLERISEGYFFESDMLFRLNTVRAVVLDIPMEARYGTEKSHLGVLSSIPEFFFKHVANFIKRVFYIHFLRNFSLASLFLVTGIPLFVFGFSYGLYRWIDCARKGIEASAGTVMLAGLPLLVGIQFLLSFFQQDVQDTPRRPLHKRL